MIRKFILAAALLPLAAEATPTRALTLDNQQMLIADDYDATVYYHLAPNFKNHFYIDMLNGGKARGWAFVDLKYATAAIWWNKEYAAKGLFDGVDSQNKLGILHQDLASNTGNAHAPLESWIRDPQVKVSGGLAYELSERMNLAVCVQWAGLDQSRDSSELADPAPDSLAKYLASGYTPGLKVESYKNAQRSSGLAIAPSVGINSERYALDLKFETIMNGLDNVHTEQVHDLVGTRSGTVTQGFKDKGAGSWLSMGKLRVPFRKGALILRGGYFNYDFSTQHTQKGTFSGTGFTAAELAGFDHVDAEENYTVKNWDSMIGWTMNMDGGAHGMVVFGLGMNSSAVRREDINYVPKTGGTGFNDLVKSTRDIQNSDSYFVPFLMGAEVEVAKFAKWSGVVSRNLVASDKSVTVAESYNSSTGLMATRSVRENSSDAAYAWKFATGVGFYFGSFTWDFAVNDQLLASSAALVNPAYQSTLTWGY